MQSATVNAENISQQTWDDDRYEFCAFEGFYIDGGSISGTFTSCTFKDVDWYWGFFSGVTFLKCRFEDCTFAGCNFTDVRFVECSLNGVRFVKDSLGRECNLTGAAAYGCRLEKCSGFSQPAVGGDLPQ